MPSFIVDPAKEKIVVDIVEDGEGVVSPVGEEEPLGMLPTMPHRRRTFRRPIAVKRKAAAMLNIWDLAQIVSGNDWITPVYGVPAGSIENTVPLTREPLNYPVSQWKGRYRKITQGLAPSYRISLKFNGGGLEPLDEGNPNWKPEGLALPEDEITRLEVIPSLPGELNRFYEGVFSHATVFPALDTDSLIVTGVPDISGERIPLKLDPKKAIDVFLSPAIFRVMAFGPETITSSTSSEDSPLAYPETRWISQFAVCGDTPTGIPASLRKTINQLVRTGVGLISDWHVWNRANLFAETALMDDLQAAYNGVTEEIVEQGLASPIRGTLTVMGANYSYIRQDGMSTAGLKVCSPNPLPPPEGSTTQVITPAELIEFPVESSAIISGSYSGQFLGLVMQGGKVYYLWR